MRNIIKLLIFLCLNFHVYAQECPEYTILIKAGNSFKKSKDFKKALNKYNAAKLCEPSKSIEVDKLITNLFDAIEKEKEEAIRLRNSAENEKRALSKLQEIYTKNKQLEIEKKNELIKNLKLENDKLEMEKISNLDLELSSNSSILIKKVITLLKEEKSKEALEILVGLTKESEKSVVSILENKAFFSNNIKLSKPQSLIHERIKAFRIQAILFSYSNDTLNEIRAYKLMIKSDSTNFMGYYDLANFYSKYKNYKEAKKYFKSVLNCTKSEDIIGEVFINLGEIDNILGNEIESIKSFQEASYCFEKLHLDSPTFKRNFEKSLESVVQLLEISNKKIESNKWKEKLWSFFPEKRVEARLNLFQIHGTVTELNSGNKPISNILINSNGANPVTTDLNGNFILSFPNYNLGEKINLKVQNSEWVIVNENDLIDLVASKINGRNVKIILSKSDLLAQNRANYFKIFLQSLDENFKKRLKTTNEKGLLTLEKEYNDLLGRAADMADLLSRKNLDDLTLSEREAINKLNESGLSEYLKYLENESNINIVRELYGERKNYVINGEKAKIEIEEAESIIKAQLSKLRFSAKEYILKYDFEKAERAYNILVEEDSLNFDNIYDFAYFLQTQNRLNEAAIWYNKSLFLTKYDDEIANVYNNLGIVHFLQKDLIKAQIMLSKAIEIRKELAKNNPIKYDSKLAETQNNLGELFQQKNNFELAINYYMKSLVIYERLKNNSSSPITIEVEIAKIQNNLGFLYYTTGQYILAQNAYQNAINIYKRLDTSNLDISPNLASSINNLGILYQAKNENGSALVSFQKTLEIRELLAKKNPAVYEVEVAVAQNNLGALYQSIKDYPSALNAYRKAFEIYSRLSKQKPDKYEIDYCRSIILLGFLQKEGFKKDSQIINEKDLLTAKQLLSKYSNNSKATFLNEKIIDLEIYFNLK